MQNARKEADAPELEEIDIEVFAKENPPDFKKPHARFYVIRIDREKKRVSMPALTGAQILSLVEKTPESHKLFQKFRGGETKVIEPDATVSFVAPGVERFQTIPKDTTEGRLITEPRRQFTLPDFDRAFLNDGCLPWESVVENKTQWVLIHEHPVVSGYNPTDATVALEILPSYPDTQIDMVYFSPRFTRSDGKSIRQLADRSFDGKVWQRWSRHRTNANPWRRGYDCIQTHLLLVDEWLERELRRTA